MSFFNKRRYCWNCQQYLFDYELDFSSKMNMDLKLDRIYTIQQLLRQLTSFVFAR